MRLFWRKQDMTQRETHAEHEQIVKRLSNVEGLVKKNATRLKRLELEVGIFKPGPIVGEEEESS